MAIAYAVYKEMIRKVLEIDRSDKEKYEADYKKAKKKKGK